MNLKNSPAINSKIVLVIIVFAFCSCDKHDFKFDEKQQCFYVHNMLRFYIEPEEDKGMSYSYNIELKEKTENGIDTLYLNNISSKYQIEACFPNIDTVVINPTCAKLSPNTRYTVTHMGYGRIYLVKNYYTDSTGKLHNEGLYRSHCKKRNVR